MKTANVSKVSVSIPTSKKSKFNLSHDVNTTFDWGSVQPIFGKMMMPGSTLNVNLEQLTRLAPMVVPTFGRVKLKNIVHFVKFKDLWPNWDAMLSQTKVTRSFGTSTNASTSTYVPKKLPCIPTNFLSAFVLAGARVNVYFSGVVGSVQENTWTCARNTYTYSSPSWSAATGAVRALLKTLLQIQDTETPITSYLPAWQNYHGYYMNVSRLLMSADGHCLVTNTYGSHLFDLPTISTLLATPLANANGQGYTHSAGNEKNSTDGVTISDSHITFSDSDMIWEFDGSNHAGITSADRAAGSGYPVEGLSSNFFDSCKIRLVFKLSSFGKRLRKVLIGLGYNINLQDSTIVSMLPLFAFYKAWWDSFAPERYRNFYETDCWKLIQLSMASANASSFGSIYGPNTAFRSSFAHFMSELGSLFATEKLDAISAATDSYYGATDSTAGAGGIQFNTDMRQAVQDQLDYLTGFAQDGEYANGSHNVDWNDTGIPKSISLYNGGTWWAVTQPQLDALKKAYIMLNKSSVAGMAVAQILRANGQGDYVEECNGKFINSSDDFIKISDVVATAATADAKLGQYGGRGLGVGNFNFSFSTNSYGYLVVLSCIVPESGYVNGPAHENEATDFEHLFNPEFDGLAYEAIQKKSLVGSPVLNDPTCNDTFGFLPTYTQWKFMSNKANGDFSLHSMANSLQPYSLDKRVPVGDPNVYSVEETYGHAGSTTELCSPPVVYSDLPNAGEDYRYINKFPWNGDYNRIFNAEGDGLEWSVYSPNNSAFLFDSFEFDNFMVHNVFTISYFAHMKSIEDSYSTYDEEHDAPKTTITKC